MTHRPVRRLVAAALRDERIRYAGVGGATSLLYFLLFAFGWRLLPLPYVLVTALAHLTTALAMYPIYRKFVFRSDARWLQGFSRFYTVWLGGLMVSVLGIPLLVEVAHSPVLVAQAVTIIAVPVFAYIGHRTWTFNGP